MDFAYLRKNGCLTLQSIVGQTLFFAFPLQGIVEKQVRKIQFTKNTKEWCFEAGTIYKMSEIGKSIFFTEDEAIHYQHFVMEQYTKKQQEKIFLKEKKQREEDLKTLEKLINKYKDNIVIKVNYLVSGSINSGVIGYRRDYADYEDVEEVKRDEKGRIEITVCICDRE